MRIGLILFGHLRSFRNTHNSYKKFLDVLQQSGTVDVFCHTWDIEESVTASWWKEHKAGDIPPANVKPNEIVEKYNPVRYFIEPSRQFDDSDYKVNSTIPVAGILSMLHSQRRSFHLLEEYCSESNVVYDVVVKTRYDLLYEIAPSFSELLTRCIANKCLYLPTSNPYELAGSYSDVFAVGPLSLAREYFRFADEFKKAMERHQQSGYKMFLPEHCLTLYLRDNNIDANELDGLRIHILRLNGDKFQVNTDRHFSSNQPLCFFSETIRTNKGILHGKTDLITNNTRHLVRKYTGWIDGEADNKSFQYYVDFYNGSWLPVRYISRLASKAKHNTVFTVQVMKGFFEEAMRNARYGQVKKILLASLLATFGGYGFFFFRVFKNISSSKNI